MTVWEVKSQFKLHVKGNKEKLCFGESGLWTLLQWRIIMMTEIKDRIMIIENSVVVDIKRPWSSGAVKHYH